MPVPSLLDHGRPINFTTSFAARSLAMRAQASSASARRIPEDLEPMRFRRGFSLDDDDESDRMDDVSKGRKERPRHRIFPTYHVLDHLCWRYQAYREMSENYANLP